MLSVAIVGECEFSANTRLESLSYVTQLRHLANVQHRHLLFAAWIDERPIKRHIIARHNIHPFLFVQLLSLLLLIHSHVDGGAVLSRTNPTLPLVDTVTI